MALEKKKIAIIAAAAVVVIGGATTGVILHNKGAKDESSSQSVIINAGDNIFFVIYLLKSVFHISDPSSVPEACHRLCRLYLVTGISHTMVCIFFFIGFDIKLPKYLLKRLFELLIKY